MVPDITNILEEFVALKCWATIAGEGSGSMVNLAFGAKIPREAPLENKHLPEVYRSNLPEHSIFIQLSSWVLENGDEEVCTCDSDNSNDGAMVRGLSKLVGLHVHYIEYIAGQGLYIDFQSDYTLSVLFDAKDVFGDGSDNLTIFSPEVKISVNSNMDLKLS